jgi:ribosomal protein S18 acetylase RimI-like enzyme
VSIEIRRLTPDDDRSRFGCGDADLDRFFQKYAGQNQFKFFVGVTYVAVRDGEILGFATVSPATLDVEDLPPSLFKKFPKYPLPVLRLARLGVDTRAQKQGIGEELLRAVFILTKHQANEVGCVGVSVDAKANAVTWYEKYGFEPIELVEGALGDRPRPTPMFLPLKSIP